MMWIAAVRDVRPSSKEKASDVLHKRIIATVITRMDETRAAYFGRVIDRLEHDQRMDIYPNLAVLVLKETIEILPTYIDPETLTDHLFHFLAEEKDTLLQVVHGVPYMANNAVLAPYCSAFVENVIRVTLETVDGVEEDNEGRTEYRLGWPITPDAFPYVDDETDVDDNI